MAKHIMIITDCFDIVEARIMQNFTKARFRRELSEIDDGDIAVIGDHPASSREIQALECSGTVISIYGFNDFEDHYDHVDLDLADAVIAVAWLDVPAKAKTILEPFASRCRFGGCSEDTDLDESESFLAIVEDIIQQ